MPSLHEQLSRVLHLLNRVEIFDLFIESFLICVIEKTILSTECVVQCVHRRRQYKQFISFNLPQYTRISFMHKRPHGKLVELFCINRIDSRPTTLLDTRMCCAFKSLEFINKIIATRRFIYIDVGPNKQFSRRCRCTVAPHD